jgi:hypothetical protein
MTGNRSKTHNRSCKRSKLSLAAVCIVVVLGFLFAGGGATASQVRPVQGAGSQPAQDGQVHQEPIVEVEVDVRDQADVALLQSLGYTCQVGVCQLELPQGEEQTLRQLGLTARVTAQAIKLSGGGAAPDGASAPDTEWYAYGEDWTNHTIPDPEYFGDWATDFETSINVWGAPDYATISRVKYGLRIVHSRVGDLYFNLYGPECGVNLWDREKNLLLGFDDGGLDDDPETDADIEFRMHETDNCNGKPVNSEWELWGHDWYWLNTGYVDYWYIYVYYQLACYELQPPGSPSPADGAVNVTRDTDLNWGDVTGASTYNVYLGTNDFFLPWLGSTTASQYYLDPLAPSTHYYWTIGAKNDCGTIAGAMWDFTTACWATDAPTVVSPADGATGVSVVADLDWEPVPGASFYRVFFGTINPPNNKIYTDTTESHLDLGTLQTNKRYYWRVEARNGCSTTSSPVWDFKTAPGIFLPIVIRQN